jgi:FixJ family two-component response regulator
MLVAHEAMAAGNLDLLLKALKAQPTWSDIPIMFLTIAGDEYHASRRLLDLLRPIGNLTILERPIQKPTLISAVQVALRSRRRQYQVRDLVKELQDSQDALQEKIEDLEKFEQVVVGRELKMIALEKEIERLKRSLAAAGCDSGQTGNWSDLSSETPL